MISDYKKKKVNQINCEQTQVYLQENDLSLNIKPYLIISLSSILKIIIIIIIIN